jgi:hypothetical protein
MQKKLNNNIILISKNMIKSTLIIIQNEKGTTQHDTSVPLLLLDGKMTTNQKIFVNFLIIIFCQWQTLLMLTTIKQKILA